MRFYGLYLFAAAQAILLLGVKASADTTLLREQLERRLTEAVRFYDPRAIVIVNLSEKQESYELPVAGLIVENATISAETSDPMITGMKITILSDEKVLPEGFSQFISSLVSELNVTPSVELRAFPPQPTPAPAAPPPPDSLVDQLKKIYERFSAAIIAAGAFLLFVLNGLLVRRTVKGFANQVTNSIQDAAKTVSETDGGPRQQQTSRTDAEARARANSQQQDPGAKPLDEKYGLQTIAAVFLDAYWTQHDGYARWLWERSSNELKMHLLSSFDFLRSYVEHLRKVQILPRGDHEDPYYLQPLPIHKTAMPDLEQAIRAQPWLIHRLPEIRVSALNLSADELLKIRRISADSAPSLASFPTSKPRTFDFARSLAVRSIEVEEELLKKEDIDLKEMSSLITLCWLSRLPAEKLATLLREFTAADLASAWSAPDSILKIIQSQLPEKKAKLVKEYLETVVPSRDSDAFKRLHLRSIEQLHALLENKEEAKPEEELLRAS